MIGWMSGWMGRWVGRRMSGWTDDEWMDDGGMGR